MAIPPINIVITDCKRLYKILERGLHSGYTAKSLTLQALQQFTAKIFGYGA